MLASVSQPHDSLERMSCILELSSPPSHSLESACLPCRLRRAPATTRPTARRTAPTAPPRRRSMRHPSTLRSQRLLLLLWSPVMTMQVCTVHLSCSCLSDMLQSGCDSLLIACAGRGPGDGGRIGDRCSSLPRDPRGSAARRTAGGHIYSSVEKERRPRSREEHAPVSLPSVLLGCGSSVSVAALDSH